MSDGTPLAADIAMPDAPGPFPAVFDYYPYRKDDVWAGYFRQHHYLAQRGFVALRVDVRGTGESGGFATDEYTLQEQLDGIAAIAWIAQQPWCNGNVGMFGISYGGFNSLQIAMHRPPALKAICPMYFTDNRYTDDSHYKGGALQMLFDTLVYGLGMVVLNAMPPYPMDAEADWSAMWEERLQGEPWMFRWLENQTYNDYWKHGSLCEDYASIQCAVYLFGGWRDGYVNANLRVFERLHCPKKLIIGPWMHILPDVGIPGPRIDFLHEMARFFDFWLNGTENGVMAEPPIAVYIQQYDTPHASRTLTTGFWRHEAGWPLERAAEIPLALAAGNALEPVAPAEEGARDYTYVPFVGTTFGMFAPTSLPILPVDQRLEDPYSQNWTSQPLVEAIEILGQPRAILTISATTDIATVVARLVDVAPDGTAALVTKGVLNLTHRDSDAAPTPIVPGERLTVVVLLDATGWLFEPGHALRLSISGADFPNTWPSPKRYTARIHFGGACDSRLILPAVGPQVPALPVPTFRPPAPFEPTAVGQAEPSVWRVTRDHIAETVEVSMRMASRTRIGDAFALFGRREAIAMVSEQNPANATIRGLSQQTLSWPLRTIDTLARGQIESTEQTFHVTIHLEITVDGLSHSSKHWMRSIPRHLL